VSDTVLIIVQLPDGSPAAFPLADVAQARLRATELGFGAASAPALSGASGQADEPLLDSRQLSALLGVGDTLLEAMAADGRIPSYRIGRFLRFGPSEVKAALRPRDSESPRHVQVLDRVGQKSRHNHKATTEMRRD
jgi:excisionase family DNA binding protein